MNIPQNFMQRCLQIVSRLLLPTGRPRCWTLQLVDGRIVTALPGWPSMLRLREHVNEQAGELVLAWGERVIHLLHFIQKVNIPD